MQQPGEDEVLEAIAHSLERGEALGDPELRARVEALGAKGHKLLAAAQEWPELFGSPQCSSATEGALSAGTRFGDFEILSFVGSGAAGEVYRARQTLLGGRIVALKILRENARSPRARRRFEREALVLADLHHPNLAEIYGVGEDDERPFLAMQFIDGPTLADVIQRQAAESDGATEAAALCLQRDVRWIAEVADALALVHAAGLVHRDVKPGNILIEVAGGSSEGQLSEDSHAVLVDFGLVRSGTELLGSDEPLMSGTLAYASPEHLLASEVSAASDVFSLGVTLHDLLWRSAPAERQSACLGLNAPDHLPPDLVAVLMRALDPAAHWRYPDAGAFAADLRRWLAGETVEARRPALLERARRSARSHAVGLLRLGLIACATLLLALLVGTAKLWRDDGATASRATEAFLAGKLAVFAEEARTIRRWWRKERFEDELLRRAVQDLDFEDSSLARIVKPLALGDRAAAHQIAAIELRLQGPSVARAALFLFEHELREFDRADADASARGVRSNALTQLTRVLGDRPARDEGERDSWSSVRSSLRKIVTAEELDRMSRLFAATALSGCAQTSDLNWLIEWADAHPVGWEEHRLGFLCAEGALRSLCSTGRGADLPYELLWKKLNSRLVVLCRRLFGVPTSASSEPVDGAVLSVATSLAYAERAVHGSTSIAETIGDAWRLPIPEPGLRPGAAFALAASAGVVSGLDLLGELDPEAPISTTYRMGMAVGAALPTVIELDGLPDLWSVAVAAGASLAALEASFQQGFDYGRQRLDGSATREDFDEDSLLGAQGADLRVHGLANFDPTARPLPDTVAARWMFDRKLPQLFGAAQPTALLASNHRRFEYGDHALIAFRFGTSEIRLPWVVDELGAADCSLRLEHLAAARSRLPFEGKVHLEVELDGEWLADLFLLNHSWRQSTVQLPANRLIPGPHVLTLRLGSLTTTTYRLKLAQIEKGD